MKIAVFSAKRYDREYIDAANGAAGHTLKYHEAPLDIDTVHLAAGYDAVCIFVNDKADAEVLEQLKAGGTGLVEGGQDTLAASGRVGPAALDRRLGPRPDRAGLVRRAVGDVGAGHGRSPGV